MFVADSGAMTLALHSNWRISLPPTLLLTLFAGCLRGGSVPPSVAPQGTLSLDETRSGQGRNQRFRVVAAVPQGRASSVSELSIVFSKPLRALALAGEENFPLIQIMPALDGRWQWIGTQALAFVPVGGRLPGATRFRVTVPGQTRALDGSQLGKDYRFEFTTRRPKLVSAVPANRSRGLKPPKELILRFNQLVLPKKVLDFASLTQLRGARSSKIAMRAENALEPTKKVKLTPQTPLLPHSKYTFRLASGFSSEEGPLPTSETADFSFRTYGPLVVKRFRCSTDTPNGLCSSDRSISLEFSNPVRIKDLKRSLKITPALPIHWSSWLDDETTSDYVSLEADFRPGRSYSLSIAPGVRDRWGQRLGRAYTRQVAIGDVWPQVEIGVRGDVLEAQQARPISIGSVNVRSYKLSAGALSPERLLKLLSENKDDQKQRLLRTWFPPRRVASGAGKNRLHRHQVNPKTLLAGGLGTLALGLSYPDPQRSRRISNEVRLVQVTDLALSGSLSRHGSLLWVNRLSSGKSVPGAKVSVHELGKAPRQLVSDQAGLVRLDLPPKRRTSDPLRLVVARHGKDWVYRTNDDYIAPWRHENVYVDLSGEQSLYGLAFTDRGIYRPGDRVQVKAVLRQETPTGNSMPRVRSVSLELVAPNGEVAKKKTASVSSFGGVSGELRVPRSARLGSWTVRLKGPKDLSVSTSFRIAEYRPVEFRVGVESDRPDYIRGQTAKYRVQADYLFGAPMAKAPQRFVVSSHQTSFQPKNSDGFSTNAEDYIRDLEEMSFGSDVVQEARRKLDEKGVFELPVKLSWKGSGFPRAFTLESTVQDLSRQTVSGRTTAIVHPASYYIGVEEPRNFFIQAPGQFPAQVVALSPRGKRLDGKSVELSLLRRRWVVARQDTGAERLHSVSRAVDTVVSKCRVITGSAPKGCSLKLKEGGYYLVLAKAKDERGNLVQASTSFFALGPGGGGWADSDDRNLELVANKPSYDVGDVAKVLIKSPFKEAEALVTVARAGVYSQRRVKLSGSTPTVDVPITDKLRPNAFVTVHLLRGRSGPRKPGRKDVGRPDFRIGHAELAIDSEARRLKVRIAPQRKEFRPGETLNVALDVSAASGQKRKAEVAFYAVDEGALMLTNYTTPDPLAVFSASRQLQVAALEGRDFLAHLGLSDLGRKLGLDKGRDGGGGSSEGGSVRKDFRQTAFFKPDIVTDSTGKAQVSFKLPDSLTTFRLMAVATSRDDRYGFGEARVVTSRRLMARPALPRFVRTGDKIQAGVVVSAKDFGPSKIQVHAKVRGVELLEAARKEVELEKNASAEVRFAMRAKRVGKAHFGFVVRGSGERDAVEVQRDVRSPAVLESVALYGTTRKEQGEKLGDLSKMRRDVGKLSLTLSSSALVGFEGGVEQLIEYPYGCTEQLSSRLLPLLPLRSLAKKFAIPLPRNASAVADKTIGEILKRQRGGGFRMWPESLETSPWVSAYALFALHHAKKHGARVPKGALESGRAYLRRYLERLTNDSVSLSTGAFMVAVLAELGVPDAGYASRLYEARDRLPVFAKAFLLQALVLSDQKAELVDQLRQEIENNLRLNANAAHISENLGDEYAVLMDSPTRSTAIVLRALLMADKKHPLAAKLVRGLLAARKNGSWRSTQETAFVMLALSDYSDKQEHRVPNFHARAWMGKKELFGADFEGHSTLAQKHSLPTSKVSYEPGTLLVFEKRGRGKLFYEARLRYAPRRLPRRALDRGFFVQRSLRAVTPESLGKATRDIPGRSMTRFVGGGLVLADVIVVTPSPRDFVVIDDPLPAGMEAIDASLATASGSLDEDGDGAEAVDEDEERDARAHGRAFTKAWHRRELRDDRVLFFVDHMPAGMYHYRYLARATTLGAFLVPPTKAEEMYSPEVFGRTGAWTVEIR